MQGGDPPPLGYSAFISHASHDHAKAQEICDELEKVGFRCWIAPRDVRPGAVYLDEIMYGIENSKCMILVLSSQANKSTFVRNEVERAYSKGKPLFPVRIEDVLPSRALELLVSTAHWVDAWRGGVAKSVALLAARLAENADLAPDLPPEIAQRIRWRRRLRALSLLAAAIVVAVAVGLVMRLMPQRQAKEMYSSPPSIFLTGGMVLPDRPVAVTALLQSGYDQDGTQDIFANAVGLSVFDVNKKPASRIYQSKPTQFSGVYQTTKVEGITIPYLPFRAAFCLNYFDKSSGQKKAAVSGYLLTPPSTQVAGLGIAAFGGTDTTTAAPEDCKRLVQAYAAEHLKGASPLEGGSSMASRDGAYQWAGQCLRDTENPALLACYLVGGAVAGDVRSIEAGFNRDKLSFVAHAPFGDTGTQPVAGASWQRPNVFYLPNLGRSVFVAKRYADGSQSAVQAVPVAVVSKDPRPPVVTIEPATAGMPRLYVGYDSHYLPQWGLVAMAPARKVAWSRDGQGYTDLTRHGDTFSALISPSAFGLGTATVPSTPDIHTLWIRITTEGKPDQVGRYNVDLWAIARQGLRAIQPVEDAIACTQETVSSAYNTTGTVCRLQQDSQAAPGFLFRSIAAGTTRDALQDLPAEWRSCGPTPAQRCTQPLYVASAAATTVFFRFEYWDGRRTPTLAVPVR